MRKIALISAALLLLGAAVLSISAVSQAAEPTTTHSETLHFDVVFSPFTPVPANNVRDPNSPFSLGDEIVFHDQLFSNGERVGDDVGSCVIVSPAPELLNSCTMVVRLPGGDITAQFATSPGPAPKALALTGGTDVYRNIGGEGTLVEFGADQGDKGTLTLDLLSLVARGGGG
jgi:hypothetical protein